MATARGDTLQQARQGRDVSSASDKGTDLDLISALCLLSREDALVRDEILIAETVDIAGYGRRKASGREAGEMLRVKACAPCSLGYEALDVRSQERLLEEVPSWRVDRSGPDSAARTFTFEHPVDALGFVNSVAILADEERHYPMLHLENGAVTIKLTTPEAHGLSESDFILAAKIDRLYSLFMEPMLSW